MTWSVETLFGLTGDAFEAERNRIISEYIKSLPEGRERNMSYAKQLELDLKREMMQPDEFNRYLAAQITESLENLADQLTALKHLIDGPPTPPACSPKPQQ
jgi:hypothetical protein